MVNAAVARCPVFGGKVARNRQRRSTRRLPAWRETKQAEIEVRALLYLASGQETLGGPRNRRDRREIGLASYAIRVAEPGVRAIKLSH
jgi:hypothetical protein